MKKQTDMKAFLLNHNGVKYKADTFIGIIWKFITKKK